MPRRLLKSIPASLKLTTGLGWYSLAIQKLNVTNDDRSISCRHAHYCLNDFKSAASAFQRGLELDPNNASLKSGLQNAEARIIPDEDNEVDMPPSSPPTGTGSAPGMGGLQDMLRNMGMGGGAGGAGGGMPDLATLMNNPMMMQMAQQMMQNGGLERLMQNPALSNMVCRLGFHL